MIFDLNREKDIIEMHHILYSSDSPHSEDAEEDCVIPDFKTQEESESIEEGESTAPAGQIESPVGPFSDSEDDTPPVHLVKIVKAPKKLYGKNKFKWSGERGVLHRIPKRNLIVHLPGNKNEARQTKYRLEVWQLCFTKENLDLITEYTNREIVVQRSKYNRNMEEESYSEFASQDNKPSYTRKTDSIEIQALIGLLYYAGVMKMGDVFTKELFHLNSGIGIFRATMPEARYRFLINYLRFNDRETRVQRKLSDKLAPFREVFERSLNKMKQLYVPSEYTTIDGQLVRFRGRCPFKMFIPSTPTRQVRDRVSDML